MSTPPSEEMLVQRQLRAAEIALETARRRRFETDEAIREFRTVAERAQAAQAEGDAARERDAAAFRARIAVLEAAALDAEQRAVVERNRRLALDQQLSALRAEAGLRDETARQLSAETRIRELEGELELVSRRAAEFEYGLRMAAVDAFRLVREMADRVDDMVGRPRRPPAPRVAAAQQRERAPFRVTAPAVQPPASIQPPATTHPPVANLPPASVVAREVDRAAAVDEDDRDMAPRAERAPTVSAWPLASVESPVGAQPPAGAQPADRDAAPAAVDPPDRFEAPDVADPATGFEPTVRWEEVASAPVRWQEAPVHFQTAPRKPHEFGAAQRLDGPPATPAAPPPAPPLWPRERPAATGPRDPASLAPLPVASVLDSQLDSHRLDAALDRLRSSAPPADDPAEDDS